jgi:hypothetical protein
MSRETQFNEELMGCAVWIRILSARAVKLIVFKSVRFYVLQDYMESGLWLIQMSFTFQLKEMLWLFSWEEYLAPVRGEVLWRPKLYSEGHYKVSSIIRLVESVKIMA